MERRPERAARSCWQRQAARPAGRFSDVVEGKPSAGCRFQLEVYSLENFHRTTPTLVADVAAQLVTFTTKKCTRLYLLVDLHELKLNIGKPKRIEKLSKASKVKWKEESGAHGNGVAMETHLTPHMMYCFTVD